MKSGLSGNITNEIEVNDRFAEQRKEALKLLTALKAKCKKEKYIKENHCTFVSEGWFELMIRRTKKDK